MDTTINETIQFTIDVDASMKRLVKQVLRQIKGVVAVRETTPKASMSKKEYYAMLDHSAQQAKNGETIAMSKDESVHQFIERLICTMNVA